MTTSKRWGPTPWTGVVEAVSLLSISVVFVSFILPICAVAAQMSCSKNTSGKVEEFGLSAPALISELKNVRFYATAYIDQLADESDDANAVPLRNSGGQPIGINVSLKNWCLAADEGTVTVRLKDGKSETYNYAGHDGAVWTDCSSIFKSQSYKSKLPALGRTVFEKVPPDSPFGLGAGKRFRLVPFRSVAVDESNNGFAKVGDVLFIPDLKGACIEKFEGGTFMHDGYVMAVDSGGAIHGAHMDFFEGPRSTDALIGNLVSKRLKDAYIVTDPNILSGLSEIHDRKR